MEDGAHLILVFQVSEYQGFVDYPEKYPRAAFLPNLMLSTCKITLYYDKMDGLTHLIDVA